MEAGKVAAFASCNKTKYERFDPRLLKELLVEYDSGRFLKLAMGRHMLPDYCKVRSLANCPLRLLFLIMYYVTQLRSKAQGKRHIIRLCPSSLAFGRGPGTGPGSLFWARLHFRD